MKNKKNKILFSLLFLTSLFLFSAECGAQAIDPSKGTKIIDPTVPDPSKGTKGSAEATTPLDPMVPNPATGTKGSATDTAIPVGGNVSAPSSATTGSTGTGGPYTNQEKIPGAQPTSDFVTYLQQILNFGFAVIGILALFMLIIGAYQYLMAAGSGNAADAKDTITSALLGLILGLCAYVILYKINPDLVNMRAISQITGGGAGGIAGQSPVSGTTGSYPATKSCQDNAVAEAAKKYASGSVTSCQLVAFASAESGCNSNAYNGTAKSGAWGMFQFLGSTAAGYGVSGDQLKGNMELSMQTANRFVNDLSKQCGGDMACIQRRYRGLDPATQDPEWLKRYNSVAANCASLGLAMNESPLRMAFSIQTISHD